MVAVPLTNIKKFFASQNFLGIPLVPGLSQHAREKLRDYSIQLSRNPEYTGFENIENFRAAMKAKAEELGLSSEAYNQYDGTMTEMWGFIPPPVSMPTGF